MLFQLAAGSSLLLLIRVSLNNLLVRAAYLRNVTSGLTGTSTLSSAATPDYIHLELWKLSEKGLT